MNDERLIVTLTVGELKDLITKAIILERLKKPMSSLDKNTTEDPEILLTRFEVATLFKVSTVTLDKWKRAGLLPKPIKMAAKVYYLKKEILAIIEANLLIK